MPNRYQSGRMDTPYMMQPESSQFAGCSEHLAIGNIPWQIYRNTYEPVRALQYGTIFPELNKPFTGRSVRA